MPYLKTESDTQIQVIRIYSPDIGMGFGIKKCAMLMMRSGKRHMTERIELPNQEKFRTFGEKEAYWEYWKQTPPIKWR